MKEPDKMHPLASFHYCPRCGGKFTICNEKACKCEACGFEYYFNPSAATVAVIVNDCDELLVCRRAKDPAKGTLDLPGGFCDMYETAEEGVAREVLEETGCQVTECRFLFSLPNRYWYSNFEVHTIDSFFCCRITGVEEMKPADDVAECMWIPLEKVVVDDFGLDSVRKGVRRLVEEWKKGR